MSALAMFSVGTQTSYADEAVLTPTQTTVIQADGKTAKNANTVFYNAEATSWRYSYAEINGGAFRNRLSNYGGTPVVLTKFDASTTLDGKLLKKATLSFSSVCTEKSSIVQVATINTGWDATTATWTNTNTAKILNAVGINGAKDEAYRVGTKKKTLTFDVTSYLQASTNNTLGIALFTASGREQEASDIKLTLEYVDAASASNYTIKYVDEDSKDIKTPVTRSSVVGSNVTATAADMETFYSTDFSEKYVYKSGNADITLTKDEASNVITLTFSKYTKFGYTINAKENRTDLGEVAKGETYTDGADIAISKFYYINKAWYETTTSPYYINIKPENKAATIEVKKSDITYFAETENLGNITGKVSDKNMSNGAYSAINGGKIAEICKLPMGEYKVTIYLKDNGNRSAIIRDVDNSDNGTNTLCSLPIYRSSAAKEYSTTLTLYETTKIGLSGYTSSNGGTNQSADLDYIYIQRTGDATEKVSVTEAGYATYATKHNVEVPSDVKVMTVKVNAAGTAIELNEVKANTVIPAKTGILVKAAQGDYNFAVTSKEGTPLENNNLVAATADEASNGTTYFALTKIGDKVGFALVEKDVVIPAGKAYLEVTKKGEAAKFFGLDGEATGINSVKTAKADGAYYTLEGVKTTKPVKGLYIHNGKKIVVK